MKRFLCVMALMTLLASAANSRAAVIMNVLGNDSPGFNDGDILPLATVNGAQAGQPVPFDVGYGLELDIGSDFNVTWTHTYGAIADPITSATLQIGIFDSEGGSVGTDESNGDVVTLGDEQLDFYTVDGTSVKTELISAGFEDGGQGLNNQYEEYLITLPSSVHGDLADGSAIIALGLKGPVFSPAVLAFLDDLVFDHNAGHIIFSKLTINTDSAVIPEPGTILLLGTGLLGILGYGWRQKRVSKKEST